MKIQLVPSELSATLPRAAVSGSDAINGWDQYQRRCNMKSLSATNGIFAVVIFLLLAGCASKPTLETGLAKLNAKDYSGAYADFVKCAEKSGDTNCMANAGAAAWNMGDPTSAMRWLKLAARKGNSWAAEKLTEYGAVQPMKSKPPSQ